MKSLSGVHSKTQTKMNHFRVLLLVFLLSPLCHMFKGLAGCSGTHPLPQCSLVSISNRCCKLELHLAGWMCLQDLLVRHALGLTSNAGTFQELVCTCSYCSSDVSCFLSKLAYLDNQQHPYEHHPALQESSSAVDQL